MADKMENSSISNFEIFLGDSEDDVCNLQVAVVVTQAEGEEMENELNDALSEIHGEKSFPCAKCQKVCKSKFFQVKKCKNSEHNKELTLLLQSMKSSDCMSSFISSRTRGGLVNPSGNLVGILEEAKKAFQKHVCESKAILRNIAVDIMCNSTFESHI